MGGRVTTPTIQEEVREVRQTAHQLLPSRDFATPGPRPMSLDDAMNKIEVEYGDALELLGRL
jgi:hypothetical protein